MTMMKKISAMAMATAMAATMAVGTAMSASAEALDTPATEEELLVASEAATTSKQISWGTRSEDVAYSMTKIMYKLDMSEVSMSNTGVTAAQITKATDDEGNSYYYIDVTTGPITKTITILGKEYTFTANVTGLSAYGYNDAPLTVTSLDSGVYRISFACDQALPYPNGASTLGYAEAIKIQFTTNLSQTALALIPEMSNPSAFMLFNISTT